MAFNNEDILTLAKAGFTAQQIAALNMVGVEQTVTPIAPTTPQSAPDVSPDPEPVTSTPSQQPTQDQATTMDEILKSVQGLTQTFQNGFIMGAQQPRAVTAEEILANIINPPSPKKEV